MCGIVGIVNGKKNRFARASLCTYMRDAIVANTLRGFDSTGLVQATKTGPHLVYTNKMATDGVAFVSAKENHAYLRDVDDSAFTLVHNRAATRGVVSVENAHPFQQTNSKGQWLIGVHNGTLNNFTASTDYQVDSDWALAQIAEHGTDAFEKFDGAYAFVWYGDREGHTTLNMARNAARPMFVAYVKGEDRMLYASEYLMMVWLAERNNISLEEEIIDLEPGFLYQFSTDNPREFTKKYLPSYKVKPRHELLFEKLNAIFGSVREEEKKKPTPPKKQTATVTQLRPTKNNKKKEEGKKNGDYVTRAEVELAKGINAKGQGVDIYLTEYVAGAKEAWGVCDVRGEMYSCVIRNVDKGTYQTWRVAESIGGRVVGAEPFDHNSERQIALIISRNVKADAVDELSAAIGTGLKELEKNNESVTRH